MEVTQGCSTKTLPLLLIIFTLTSNLPYCHMLPIVFFKITWVPTFPCWWSWECILSEGIRESLRWENARNILRPLGKKRIFSAVPTTTSTERQQHCTILKWQSFATTDLLPSVWNFVALKAVLLPFTTLIEGNWAQMPFSVLEVLSHNYVWAFGWPT